MRDLACTLSLLSATLSGRLLWRRREGVSPAFRGREGTRVKSYLHLPGPSKAFIWCSPSILWCLPMFCTCLCVRLSRTLRVVHFDAEGSPFFPVTLIDSEHPFPDHQSQFFREFIAFIQLLTPIVYFVFALSSIQTSNILLPSKSQSHICSFDPTNSTVCSFSSNLCDETTTRPSHSHLVFHLIVNFATTAETATAT